MNKKIKQYSALALAAATVIPMACKKEEKNDANIEDKSINKIITAVGTATEYEKEDSIDIDGDGQFDFEFVVGGEIYDGTTYGFSGASGKKSGDDILALDQTFGPYTVPVAIAKNSGDKLNSTSTNWENFAYFGYKYGSQEIGFAGDGDKLLGFRFKSGVNTHYGWMKVNLAADYKTLTIKELAYHKTPNTEIEAGAK
jgi:hypothetical protein